jgi:molybdate transport system regulatory protein
MLPMKSKVPGHQFQPRLRIICGRDIAMGPGKADLLEQVAKHGSITEAAGHLSMSYMRAWTLLKTMERCFRQPLVTVSRGGAKHGGAQLTATGRRVLALYRRMETISLTATATARREMAGLLRG